MSTPNLIGGKVILQITVLLGAISFVIANGNLLQRKRQRPPNIVTPNGYSHSHMYIRPNTWQQLHCNVEGYPLRTYKWSINKTFINELQDNFNICKKMMSVYSNGTLNIERFVRICNGDYQCMATNRNGVVISRFITLTAAIGTSFGGNIRELPERKLIDCYQYLMLSCEKDGQLPNSEPSLKILWYRSNQFTGEVKVQEDERIVIDPQGNLHFLWILPSDHKSSYRCAGVNDVLLVEYKSVRKYLIEVQNQSWSERGPELVYNADVVARENTDATLLCLFSYLSSNDLKITWLKESKVLETDWNYRIPTNISSGRVLIVKSIHVSSKKIDIGGKYVCVGKLPGYDEVRGEVVLTVEAEPHFTHNGRLTDSEAIVGHSAEFTCKTYSHDSWTKPVIWMINGIPINDPCMEGKTSCYQRCISAAETCSERLCKYPKFMCADRSSCITEKKVCDGQSDCSDNSDENDCPDSPDQIFGRFTIAGDGTKLTLNNVSQDDKLCIQCLVENVHGKLIGNGCLNVKENTRCNNENGTCVSCKNGFYGRLCQLFCSETCTESCDRFSGKCDACITGYFGTFCKIRCSPYCSEMNESEQLDHFNLEICDRNSGYCTHGCAEGWYNHTCLNPCSSSCHRQKCNSDNGTCLQGCIPGYTGDFCNNEKIGPAKSEVLNYLRLGIAAAATVGGFIVLMLALSLMGFGAYRIVACSCKTDAYEVTRTSASGEQTNDTSERFFAGLADDHYSMIRESVAIEQSNALHDGLAHGAYATIRQLESRMAASVSQTVISGDGINSNDCALHVTEEPPPIPPKNWEKNSYEALKKTL